MAIGHIKPYKRFSGSWHPRYKAHSFFVLGASIRNNSVDSYGSSTEICGSGIAARYLLNAVARIQGPRSLNYRWSWKIAPRLPAIHINRLAVKERKASFYCLKYLPPCNPQGNKQLIIVDGSLWLETHHLGICCDQYWRNW